MQKEKLYIYMNKKRVKWWQNIDKLHAEYKQAIQRNKLHLSSLSINPSWYSWFGAILVSSQFVLSLVFFYLGKVCKLCGTLSFNSISRLFILLHSILISQKFFYVFCFNFTIGMFWYFPLLCIHYNTLSYTGINENTQLYHNISVPALFIIFRLWSWISTVEPWMV